MVWDRYERDDEMKQVIEWFMGPNGILCILVIIFAFIHWGLKIRYLSIKNIVMNHINCFRNPNGKLLVVPVFIYMIMPLFIAIYIAKNKIVTADILNILTIIISILTAMLFTLLTVIIDMKNKIKVDNKYSGVEAQNIIQALKETYYTIMFEIFISILLLILCLINVFTSEYTFLQSILIYYFSLLMIMNLLMILKRISAVLDVEIEK